MPKSLGRYLAEQLVLKISLINSEPNIWRRVEVHSGLTLHELHLVIQCVFDWQECHLYQFLAPPGGKLTQRAMAAATRYQIEPDEPFFGDEENQDRPADESLVGQVLNKEQKQIVYEYDFGDSWMHLVKVEKRTPGGDQSHIPVCLAGEQAAPRDDMGGIGGYYQWLYALGHKKDESHEDAVEWLGEDFDAAHFELDLANERLKATFKPIPKKPRKRRKKQS